MAYKNVSLLGNTTSKINRFSPTVQWSNVRTGLMPGGTVTSLGKEPWLAGVNPYDPYWYESPNALSSYDWSQLNPEATNNYYARMAGQERWAMPENIPASVATNPRELADWWARESANRGSNTRGYLDTLRSQEAAAQATHAGYQSAYDVLGTLQNQGTDLYNTYLAQQWTPAHTAAIAEQQNAINQALRSPTRIALVEKSQPDYKAISDEFVQGQWSAAGRDIAKESANAIAAALQQSAGRGLTGSALSSQLSTANRFQRASDLASLRAELEADQLAANIEARDKALAELGLSDRDIAAMRENLATIKGETAPTNPYYATQAGLAATEAGLRAGEPQEYYDLSESFTPEQVALWEQPLGEIQGFVDELFADATADRDYFMKKAEEMGLQREAEQALYNGITTLGVAGVLWPVIKAVLGM